jgi:malonyl-CoA O-methyltransferase
MIGHVPECEPVYRELARVAARGAQVVVTDFHPAAYALGQRRTFRDGGEVVEVEHHVHTPERQVAAAGVEGLKLQTAADGTIGPAVRGYFDRAGKSALYREGRGQPVVLGLSFVRDG